MHTATKLVELSIKAIEVLLLANFQNGYNLEESVRHALGLMTFTTHTTKSEGRSKCTTVEKRGQFVCIPAIPTNSTIKMQK